MRSAESVEEAWAYIEQAFGEEECLVQELEYCLTDPAANDISWDAAFDILNDRCCCCGGGTGEECFWIDGHLWLLAYSYG